MCSIDGFTGTHSFTIEQFGAFNAERGPDGTNYYKTPDVSIAHSLLAISPNAQMIQQPVVDHTSGNVLAYNGEIYGLEPGTFDTQWLFNLLQKEGIGGLKYNVNGMWAFVYYEPIAGTITLCRDHFGVKPLYYMDIDGELFFASTPKPLYATLNELYGNVTIDATGRKKWEKNDRFLFGTDTPFKHIKKVAPGQIMVWSLRERKFTSVDSLWGNNSDRFCLSTNYDYDPDEFRELFVKCMTQVGSAPGIPKAVSLSGGLDSSLIASINKDQDNLFACTMSFEERKNYWNTTNSKMFSESDMAIQTANELGIPIHVGETPHDYNSYTQEAYFNLGVTMWDRARIVPRYLNVKNAKNNGAKIYMVGDLADELVTGYNGDYDYYRHLRHRPGVYPGSIKEYGRKSIKWREMQKFCYDHILGDDFINNKLWLRCMMHADGFCTTVDHLAGSQGMESRVPFLHQELAKYLLTIPSAVKLHVPWEIKGEERNRRKGIYKYVFREFLGDYIPDHIKERKDKAGFAAPWNSRDRQLNNRIGQEDMNLVKAQANKYYKNMTVVKDPVFEYNDEEIVYNLSTGEIEDG